MELRDLIDAYWRLKAQQLFETEHNRCQIFRKLN